MTQKLPTIGYELIGPDEAYELLANNTHNRVLRPRSVEMYARDMKEGKWLPVGEPLEFATDGTVLNGQHRLMAVIEADVGRIRFPVIRGLDKSAQRVVDQGVKRTFGDVLKLTYGEGDASLVAAAVRMIYHFRTTGQIGVTGNSPFANPSIAELLTTYEAEPNLKHSVAVGRATAREVHISGGLAVALHYLFNEADPIETDPFFERFATGTSLEPGDVILSLRRTFMGKDKPKNVRHASALMIKGFNYWREGRTMQNLRWRGGGSAPEVYPVIEPGQDND